MPELTYVFSLLPVQSLLFLLTCYFLSGKEVLKVGTSVKSEWVRKSAKPDIVFAALLSRHVTDPRRTIVVDTCCGTATSGIAALNLGCYYLGCDLDAGLLATLPPYIQERRSILGEGQPYYSYCRMRVDFGMFKKSPIFLIGDGAPEHGMSFFCFHTPCSLFLLSSCPFFSFSDEDFWWPTSGSPAWRSTAGVVVGLQMLSKSTALDTKEGTEGQVGATNPTPSLSFKDKYGLGLEDFNPDDAGRVQTLHNDLGTPSSSNTSSSRKNSSASSTTLSRDFDPEDAEGSSSSSSFTEEVPQRKRKKGRKEQARDTSEEFGSPSPILPSSRKSAGLRKKNKTASVKKTGKGALDSKDSGGSMSSNSSQEDIPHRKRKRGRKEVITISE